MPAVAVVPVVPFVVAAGVVVVPAPLVAVVVVGCPKRLAPAVEAVVAGAVDVGAVDVVVPGCVVEEPPNREPVGFAAVVDPPNKDGAEAGVLEGAVEMAAGFPNKAGVVAVVVAVALESGADVVVGLTLPNKVAAGAVVVAVAAAGAAEEVA